MNDREERLLKYAEILSKDPWTSSLPEVRAIAQFVVEKLTTLTIADIGWSWQHEGMIAFDDDGDEVIMLHLVPNSGVHCAWKGEDDRLHLLICRESSLRPTGRYFDAGNQLINNSQEA